LTIAFPVATLILGALSSIPVIDVPLVAAMETPCEKICIVDQPSGLCRGCGRSLAEIGHWTAYSNAERTRIMAELPKRLEAMNARRALSRQG